MPTGQSGYSVQEWCDAVRAAKRKEHRVFVVMHLFLRRTKTTRRPGMVGRLDGGSGATAFDDFD